MAKNLFSIIFLILICTITLQAQTFTKASKNPILLQNGKEKFWCPVSGIKLENTYKTNWAAKLQNETQRQYSSLYALLEDDKEYGIDKNSILVVDTVNENFINAKKAFFVINSKIKGLMNKSAILAFKKKEKAQKFIKKYKGEIKNFDEVIKLAKNSYEEVKKALKIKKEKKIYKMGKKIYSKKCKEINPNDYLEINELKADIIENSFCKNLKEKYLHSVALYLWEIKRVGELNESEHIIKVNKNDKCPVCGMFVAKYPRWVAQIFYKRNDIEHKYSFDGVKDMMKFYFNSKRWAKFTLKKDKITKILVTDYYSQKAIEGTKAFYVIGSNIYGPMGNELIPFKYKGDAVTFKKDHFASKIVNFEKIKEKEVYKLDN